MLSKTSEANGGFRSRDSNKEQGACGCSKMARSHRDVIMDDSLLAGRTVTTPST